MLASCRALPVLLVDEDPIFREALAENLRSDGHDVVECGSATEALAAIRRGKSAVLVTEYVVAGTSGIHLADEIRGVRSLPSLVVTAHSSGAVHAHALLRPYVRLLPKPVDYDVLHDELHRACASLGSHESEGRTRGSPARENGGAAARVDRTQGGSLE